MKSITKLIVCASLFALISCGVEAQSETTVIATGTTFTPEVSVLGIVETIPETITTEAPTTTASTTTAPTTVKKTTTTTVKPKPATTTTQPTTTATQAKGSCKEWIQQAGIQEIESAYYIVMKESTCNPNARNKSSGACGLVQANPCSKLGANWSDPIHALKWADNYVKSRYGSWSGAVSHSKKHGWY